MPLGLAIDNADDLAKPGSGLDTAFLGFLRYLTVERKLTWLSASRRELSQRLNEAGLLSEFLNNSIAVELGGWEPEEVDAFLAGVSPPHRARLAEVAGSCPYGLQRLASHLQGIPVDGDPSPAVDEFVDHVDRQLFPAWWDLRTQEDRELLRLTARTDGYAATDDLARRRLRKLARRGLVVERKDHRFVVLGSAWRDFVTRA